MRAGAGPLLVALLLLPRPAHGQGFTDVTVASGLEAVRAARAGDYWMSGLLFADLDGDDDLDFFFGAHHGEGGVAALNDGHGHYTAAANWSPSEIHLAYDLDEDGRLDVSLTEGDGGGRWWRNGSTPGALVFGKTALFDLQARAQYLLDIDRDGHADWITVGAGSGTTAGPGTRFYRGDGKGGLTFGGMLAGAVTFTDLVDLDGDGDKDALRARGNYPNSPPEPVETQIFRNDGMTFTDVTAQAGLAVPGLFINGWGDVDQDGDIDLIGLENNGSFPVAIYLNDGKGVFTRKPGAVNGPTGRAIAPNPGLATVTDLDNDGIPDILIGGVSFFQVLHGTGGGNFEHVNKAWGGISSAGQLPDASFAFGDMDGDGDLDLACYRATDSKLLNVYRNDLPRRNWLNVRVVGAPGNKGAMGSWIRVYEAGTGKLLWFEELSLRAHQVQQNYYALAETERHFGLGDRTVVDVDVHFYPSNKVVKKSGVAANSVVRIGEDGSGTIEVPPAQPPLPPVEGPPSDAAATADGAAGPRPARDAGPGPDPAAADATAGAPPPGADATPEDTGPEVVAGCHCHVGAARGRAQFASVWSLLLGLALGRRLFFSSRRHDG